MPRDERLRPALAAYHRPAHGQPTACAQHACAHRQPAISLRLQRQHGSTALDHRPCPKPSTCSWCLAKACHQAPAARALDINVRHFSTSGHVPLLPPSPALARAFTSTPGRSLEQQMQADTRLETACTICATHSFFLMPVRLSQQPSLPRWLRISGAPAPLLKFLPPTRDQHVTHLRAFRYMWRNMAAAARYTLCAVLLLSSARPPRGAPIERPLHSRAFHSPSLNPPRKKVESTRDVVASAIGRVDSCVLWAACWNPVLVATRCILLFTLLHRAACVPLLHCSACAPLLHCSACVPLLPRAACVPLPRVRLLPLPRVSLCLCNMFFCLCRVFCCGSLYCAPFFLPSVSLFRGFFCP